MLRKPEEHRRWPHSIEIHLNKVEERVNLTQLLKCGSAFLSDCHSHRGSCRFFAIGFLTAMTLSSKDLTPRLSATDFRRKKKIHTENVVVGIIGHWLWTTPTAPEKLLRGWVAVQRKRMCSKLNSRIRQERRQGSIASSQTKTSTLQLWKRAAGIR